MVDLALTGPRVNWERCPRIAGAINAAGERLYPSRRSRVHACARAASARCASDSPDCPLLIQHAAVGPAGSQARIVVCTVPEVRALLDHFSGLTDTLAGLGDPDANVMRHRSGVRRAIIAAGA